MAIKLGAYDKKPIYNKDEYLKKFIPLVIKNGSEFDNFSIFDLHKSLDISEKEKIVFKDLIFDIRKHLVSNGIAEMYGSRKITLTEKGRDIKNGTEKIFGTIINNSFSNSTIGTVIQESDLYNSPITNEVNPEPNIKPDKKSSVKKILDSLTNNKLVILIISLVVEEITFGKIWKFISDLI